MYRKLPGLRVGLILCPFVVVAIAHADVVIEESITLDGAAGFSMLAMNGSSTTSLTPEKSRLDSDMKFNSRLMNRFAGKGGNTSQIVRLDKGVVYDIQHADKQYTEMTFAEMKAAMQKAMQQMEAAAEQQAAAQPQQLPVSAEDCQWSEPVVEAKQTGEHATIAGYDAARATVSLKQSCTDSKTQKTCDMVWTIDQWLASTAPGGDESRAFALNYAKQLGLDAASMKAMQGRMQQAFSQYKSSWTEAMKKAGEFQGYPLKTALQMSMGGPQCTTDDGTQVASDPAFADAVDAGMQAGASTAAGVAGQAAGQAAGEAVGGSVGGAIAGSAAGAFASKLGSSMLAKLKKKDKPAEAPAPEQATGDAANTGMIRLFRMTSETTAIRSGAIPGATFDLPAGYKKVTSPLVTPPVAE
jgi:hypothetical protein